MRILILAHAYPPRRHVGAIRAEALARALAERNHVVDVITERVPNSDNGVETPNITTHRLAALPKPVRVAAKGIARLTRKSDDPAPEQDTPRSPSTWHRMKRAILSVLRLPDEESGLMLPALLRALSLGLRNVDVVYSTGPPHSSHLVAATLTALSPRLRWIAELRDPWAANPTNVHATAVSEAITRRLERFSLSRADSIVFATSRIQEELRRRLGSAFPGHSTVVYNGIHQTPRLAPHRRDQHDVTILYAGECYHKRDPRPFLHAIARLQQHRPPTALPIRMKFLGGCRTYNGQSLLELVQQLGLEHRVDFLDWLPPPDARAQMANADLLLLLAQDQPAQVPNKLYDYLGARRPIIAVIDTDGESARLLREVSGHYLLTDNTEPAFFECLGDLLRGGTVPPFTGSDEALSRLSAQAQLERLVGHIETVAAGPQ